MPSRREQITMSMDEVRTYLKQQPRLILVSNGVNGFPHPMPMNFVYDDEDAFLVTTFRKSQKVKNYERDPRAALLVESGRDYHELKSVLAYAEAEIIDDMDYVLRVMESLNRKETSGDEARMKTMVEAGRVSAPKRVVLRFRPDSYISWDHSKLGEVY